MSWTRTLAAVAAVAAGCGDNLPGPTEAPPGFDGGAVRPLGCDHRSVTRPGAEAPAPSTAELGPDPSIRHVHLGLVGDPRTSMVVSWRTGDDVTLAGRVRYGQDGALDREVNGYTFRYATGYSTTGEAQVRMHEAHLCGLEPDTAYDYQVVSDDGHRSPVYRFHTAPDRALTPDATVTIASVGDSRDGYQVWARVVEQLRQRAPDLVLFSGDAVTFGPVQDEWDEFFAVAEPLFATTPVVAVHGNHELNAINYYSQLAMPGDEESFGFDYGPVRVTVANDSPALAGDLAGSIAHFLDEDLAADAPWKLVTHHRPAYSASSGHGSDETLQAEWVPIFDRHGVDLVLNGHEHTYERTHPLRGGERAAGGTVYVVSGGAGATLYDPGMEWFTARSAKLHSAVTVKVRRGLLELEAFDQDGAPVDALVLEKP